MGVDSEACIVFGKQPADLKEAMPYSILAGAPKGPCPPRISQKFALCAFQRGRLGDCSRAQLGS